MVNPSWGKGTGRKLLVGLTKRFCLRRRRNHHEKEDPSFRSPIERMGQFKTSFLSVTKQRYYGFFSAGGCGFGLSGRGHHCFRVPEISCCRRDLFRWIAKFG